MSLTCLASPAKAQPRLRVSDNHRYLVREDGKPFFYLGDTAWELFHRLNREEADRYLKNRADKGFSFIQAVAIAELDGHKDPNPYGHLPLIDLDPARPDVKEGPENDYWDHVDYIINKGSHAKAWWFNPRAGEASSVGEFATLGTREFVPPAPGEHLDWVLVLDDASRNFPPPGSMPLQ